MSRTTRCQRFGRRSGRDGATTVEVAVVLPFYMSFILALMGFGHAFMVNNMLGVACRSAARLGSTAGVSTSDVRTRAENVFSPVVNPVSVSLIVKDASIYDDTSLPTLPDAVDELDALPDIETGDAEPRDLFVVKAEVNYKDIAILPLPFLDGVVLRGYAFARHE